MRSSRPTVARLRVIDETGRVSKLKPIKCTGPLLVDSAMDAVRGWEYEPATQDGRPVAVVMTATVRYTLR